MKKVLGVLVLVLLSVCCLFGCKKNDKDVIKLGVVSNLSVAAQFYGEEVVNGYKLAVSEINANGGVEVNGKKMKCGLTRRRLKLLYQHIYFRVIRNAVEIFGSPRIPPFDHQIGCFVIDFGGIRSSNAGNCHCSNQNACKETFHQGGLLLYQYL